MFYLYKFDLSKFISVASDDELTTFYCNSEQQVKTFIFFELFSKYKQENTKATFQSVLQNFFTNSSRICSQNKEQNKIKLRINKNIFLTDEEFHSNHIQQTFQFQIPEGRQLLQKNYQDLLKLFPAQLDWALKDVGFQVKDQKNCEASYAFAAISALEAAISIKHKTIITLSVQEIIDCSNGFGNNGCISGEASKVYDYIKENGINLKINYSFENKQQQCLSPTFLPVFKALKGYLYPETNIINILQFLQYGPIVVYHQMPVNFQYYSKGIFSINSCKNIELVNHTSLLVGYNLLNNPPYFRLKNSWGREWGENGYYRVEIGDINLTNPGFCNLLINGLNIFPVLN